MHIEEALAINIVISNNDNFTFEIFLHNNC